MSNSTTRLPSYQSAVDFVENPNTINAIKVTGSWLGRALIVATAMGFTGKSFEDSLKDGLIAATGIELFVLGHAIYEVKFAEPAQPAIDNSAT